MTQKIALAINHLLKQSDSLEIPGFGCLSKLSQHANFSANKAQLNAGKQILVFEKNEASKDFQLAEQLAKQENITVQEAQNYLTDTVNEWKILIDKGESIVLENIGGIKAENDTWKLTPIDESDLDEESYGFSPIKLATAKTDDENLVTDAISDANENNESSSSPIINWKDRLLAKIKTWNWRNISIASAVFLIAYTFLFVISRPSIFSKQKTRNMFIDLYYKKMKGGSADHAMKLSKKMPKLGENKEMVKAKKMEEKAMMTKKDETKKKVMEIAKGQLAGLMKKKDN